MASWRIDGGPWSKPKSLSSPATRASAPQVAVNGRSAVVVWKSAGRIMASRHPAGSGWTRPVAVSGETPKANKLDVAMDRRGDITVVWQYPAGTRTVRNLAVRAVRRLEGGRWGESVRLSGPLSRPTWDKRPQVAMGGRGRTTVVWQRLTLADLLSHGDATLERGSQLVGAGETGHKGRGLQWATCGSHERARRYCGHLARLPEI